VTSIEYIIMATLIIRSKEELYYIKGELLRYHY